MHHPLPANPSITSAEIYQIVADFTYDWEELLDTSGRCLYVSPSCERITGYSDQEFYADPVLFLNIVHPEDRSLVEAHRQAETAGATTGEKLTFRVLHRNGEIHWIDHYCQPAYHKGNRLGQRGSNRDITELHQALQSLQESEARYRTLIETSPDGITMTDVSGRLVSANQRCLDMYQFASLEEFKATARKPYDLLIPEDWERAAESRKRNFLTQTTALEEYTSIRKDGSRLPIETRTALVRDQQGNPQGIITIIRDITKRKQAEKSLRESQEHLRRLIDTSPVTFVSFDTSGIITLAEGRALSKLIQNIYPNISALSELVGTSIFTIAARLPGGLERVQHVLAGKEFSSENIIPPGWVVNVHYYPITSRDGAQSGQVTGGVVIALNVTEYKHTQNELHQAKQQLEAILNGATDGIVAMHSNGEVAYSNAAAAQMARYSSAEDITQSSSEELIQRFDFRDEAGNPVPSKNLPGRRCLDGSRYPPIILNYRLLNSQERRWARISDTPLFDKNGVLDKIVVVISDFTDNKLAEQLAHQHQQELERQVAERTAALRAEVAERQRAEEQIQRHVALLESLTNIAAQINGQLDLHTILDTIGQAIIQTIDYPLCGVMLYDETCDCICPASASGTYTDIALHAAPMPRALYDKYLGSAPITILDDISLIDETLDWPIVTEIKTRTLINIALTHEDEFIGSLSILSVGEVRRPSADELNFLTGLAHLASAAIVKARLYQQSLNDRQYLATLSQQIVDTQEIERRHLARELHDQISQTLTYLKIVLNTSHQAALDKNVLAPEMETELRRAHSLVDELLQRAHQLSANLRPPMLDDLGLLPALIQHIEIYENQTSIQVDFQHSIPDRRFPPKIEISAFRLIQEALTNIARYSGAQEAAVRLWADEDILGIQVKDNGRGFDVQQTLNARFSGGLSGMIERVKLLGGEIEFESEPGNGTCLTAELPLKNIG